MASYEDWNRIDEDEEEELEDASYYEGKKDVILFCIDCSPSMLELREHPKYENLQTCHLYTALEAAMNIEKRKVMVGPNDAVGIMLFNTTKRNESDGQSAEIKRGNFVYQPIETINAPNVQDVMRLLEAAKEDPNYLRETFPPMTEGRVPMGDVFTSCNWVIRDGAPKTATKRVFLVTDEDDPHPGAAKERLITTARTTLIDLVQAGVTVEPFFISTEEKPFSPSKFYSAVLLPTNVVDDDDAEGSILPESISIARVDELLAQMRIRELPKRAQFSVPFQLATDFTIGVKGYGLITEQKKGAYKYFVDLGDRMEVANSRTTYVDEDTQAEADKARILYGMELGATAESAEDEVGGMGLRIAPTDSRVFYTAEELRSFRTLGLDPMIKLLGFKKRSDLSFEDNIKHALFIYPDEMTYSGSKRTFTALLHTMIKKKKIGLVLAVTRRNATPQFCALLPQAEKVDEGGWHEPAGFHLIPLPFADDIRAAPVEESARASDELKDETRKFIDKLTIKTGAYNPDAFPNPALGYHNAQLEASAFREEFDPAAFEDRTIPKYDGMHKRAGTLIRAWKEALLQDESATMTIITAGSKRKADVSVDEAEIRSKYEVGTLEKLRVDQLKEFLKSRSQPVSGKKTELVDRVSEWLDKHP
ncbi:Ku DNA-binding complex, Ku70 subunit [Daedalea quercina L-15889]|uniref:ATP-dependent DNA helicase II subunit 1 n=1 Tax=Daedalea quercina L-15889 TaxID=1314783 RepID=A0A165THL1_9APHY|nr:Ku DNA-binding complex, Ku70 subunit [Daedalea quercina L-15889]